MGRVSFIQYREEGLTVWRAYNIGQSKLLSWGKFDVPNKEEMSSLLSITSDSNSVANFVSVKSRRVKSATPEVTEPEVIDDNTDELIKQCVTRISLPKILPEILIPPKAPRTCKT